MEVSDVFDQPYMRQMKINVQDSEHFEEIRRSIRKGNIEETRRLLENYLQREKVDSIFPKL